MNLRNKTKKGLIIALVVALLVMVLPASVMAADGDLVRFRFENRDEAPVSIRLYSQDGTGRAYYMAVGAESTRIMTPEAGVYDFRLTSCGVVVRGEVDLTKNYNWVLPACGNKGGPGTSAPSTTDVSEIVRLVSVDLVNETSTRIQVRLYGPYDYIITLEGKETKVVTILKGQYDYVLFACFTGVYSGSFHAHATTVQEFRCE